MKSFWRAIDWHQVRQDCSILKLAMIFQVRKYILVRDCRYANDIDWTYVGTWVSIEVLSIPHSEIPYQGYYFFWSQYWRGQSHSYRKRVLYDMRLWSAQEGLANADNFNSILCRLPRRRSNTALSARGGDVYHHAASDKGWFLFSFSHFVTIIKLYLLGLCNSHALYSARFWFACL